MTCRSNKIKTSMNSKIDLVYAPWLLFLQHVRLMLIIQELYNWHPRIVVVHVVPETGSVNDGKANCGKPQPVVLICKPRESYIRQNTFEEFFLQLCFSDLYFNCFIHLLRVAAPVVGIVFDCG